MPNRLGRMTSARRSAHDLEPLRERRGHAAVRALRDREPAQAVFDDDDGAVDDQAEVERAEAHEIAADPALDHAGDREQHRERDHERGDERRTQVAEQREQHDDHEDRAFDQVRAHRRDGLVDERRAVVDGVEPQAWRQRAIDLGELVGRGPRDDCGCSRPSA